MLKRILSVLFSPGPADAGKERAGDLEPPDAVEVADSRFVVSEHLSYSEGLPHLQWAEVTQWVATLPDDAKRDHAWACARGHGSIIFVPHWAPATRFGNRAPPCCCVR
jgi:hypothetical protein